MKKILLNILLIIFCFVFVPESCVGATDKPPSVDQVQSPVMFTTVLNRFNEELAKDEWQKKLTKNDPKVLDGWNLKLEDMHLDDMIYHTKGHHHVVGDNSKFGKKINCEIKLKKNGENIPLQSYITALNQNKILNEKRQHLEEEIKKIEEVENKLNELFPSLKEKSSSSSSSDSENHNSPHDTSRELVSKVQTTFSMLIDELDKLQNIAILRDEEKVEDETLEILEKYKTDFENNLSKINNVLKELEDLTKNEKYIKHMTWGNCGDELNKCINRIYASQTKLSDISQNTQQKIEFNNTIIENVKTFLEKFNLNSENEKKAFIDWVIDKKDTGADRKVITAINAIGEKDIDAFVLKTLGDLHSIKKGNIEDGCLKLVLQMKSPIHYFKQTKIDDTLYEVEDEFSSEMRLILGKGSSGILEVKTIYIRPKLKISF